MPSPAELKRTIGLRDLTLFYLAAVMSVRWTAMAASAGPSVLVIWIAALFCFFVPLAACVMELSSRYPQEGGLYVWSREAFGDFSGFTAAWAYWMSNLPYLPGVLYFGAASVLFALGSRGREWSASPGYFMWFALIWIAAITVMNILGVNAGKWLNNVSSMGGTISLAALILLGAVSCWRFGAVTPITAASLAPHWSVKNAIFWSSVFFAFAGVEMGSAMGDEIKQPRRVIPLAILMGGCVIVIGYVAGTASLLIALPSGAVSGPEGFMNGVGALSSHLGVGWMLVPLALLVGLNGVGGAAASLSSTSRLPFVAGIDHYLPSAFGKIHPRFRTPWVAIGVYGLAAMGMALFSQAGTTVHGAYDVLVSMAVLTEFLPFLFVFSAIIRVQGRPVSADVRRVPGGRPVAIVLAGVGLASTLLTIVLSVIPADDDPHPAWAVVKVAGATAVLVGAGIVVFLIERRRLSASFSLDMK